MKNFKSFCGLVNHLIEIADHDVTCLRGVEYFKEEQVSAIIEIKAFIDNQIGEYF